jgi:hypothetical protein
MVLYLGVELSASSVAAAAAAAADDDDNDVEANNAPDNIPLVDA